MSTLVLVISGLVLWCLLSLPAAVAVGRAFRAADMDSAFDEIVRDHDVARV